MLYLSRKNLVVLFFLIRISSAFVMLFFNKNASGKFHQQDDILRNPAYYIFSQQGHKVGIIPGAFNTSFLQNQLNSWENQIKIIILQAKEIALQLPVGNHSRSSCNEKLVDVIFQRQPKENAPRRRKTLDDFPGHTALIQSSQNLGSWMRYNILCSLTFIETYPSLKQIISNKFYNVQFYFNTFYGVRSSLPANQHMPSSYEKLLHLSRLFMKDAAQITAQFFKKIRWYKISEKSQIILNYFIQKHNISTKEKNLFLACIGIAD